MRGPDEPNDIGRLKRRTDFLRVAKGKRWHGKTLSLQAARRDRPTDTTATARVGFTLTRKVGNAVIRNRARRRLKEALRLTRDLPLERDHDYVIVGRIDAVRLKFDDIRSELARAVAGIHKPRGRPEETKSARSIRPQRTRLTP